MEDNHKAAVFIYRGFFVHNAQPMGNREFFGEITARCFFALQIYAYLCCVRGKNKLIFYVY